LLAKWPCATSKIVDGLVLLSQSANGLVPPLKSEGGLV